MHSIFKFRKEVTPEILELLTSVTLGTNGAHYRHLDTRERVLEADNPVFLSIERHTKVLGNVTFCQREKDWYLRYFAFDNALQSSGEKKSKGREGLLKRELGRFFDELLNGNTEYGDVKAVYAYIDPHNEKSLWMSQNFGFKQIGTVATQTFSRVRHSKKHRVRMVSDWKDVSSAVDSYYGNHDFYHTTQTQKPPYYVLYDAQGELLACAKVTRVNWEIKRLPGKLGGVLTKVIPFIPGLNRLIKPKHHSFIVPEGVVARDNDANVLTELFEGILALENEHVIIWWMDQEDELYTSVQPAVNWGLLNKIVGVNEVHLVCRKREATPKRNPPFYTSGFDFV